MSMNRGLLGPRDPATCQELEDRMNAEAQAMQAAEDAKKIENIYAKATRWIFDRKGRVDWWRWQVLTAHNKDPEGMMLDLRTAFVIFADLTHRGLMVPVIAPDGSEAFTINTAQTAEWQKLMNPSGWRVKQTLTRLYDWIGSGIIGTIIGLIIGYFLGKN